MSNSFQNLRAILALALLTAAACEASAQQTDWTNPTIGNWFISSNWNAGVPQSGSIAEVNNAGAPIIDSAGAVADFLFLSGECAGSGSVFVRGNGRLTLGAWLGVYNGTFEVNSGARVTVLNDPNIGGVTEIGHCGNTGTVRVTDPGSYLSTPDLQMPGNGESGTGILRVENGGRVDSTYADMYGNSTATVTGSNSIWAVSGLSGANVTISSGGILSAAFVGTRTITVTGAGSALNTMNGASYSLVVGQSGAGATLNVQSGGKTTSTNAILGDGSTMYPGSGTVSVTGGGSAWTNNGILYLGGSDNGAGSVGTGTVNLSSGGLLTTGPTDAGYTSPSIGNVSVTGAGTKWNNSGDLVFGLSGTGTLSIQSGGAVSSAGFANVRGYLGFNNGASGSATVSGAGSSWTTTGSLWVGNAGSGSLDVSNGGKVITGGNGYLGYATSAYGSATISGASSAWNTAGAIYIGGNGSAPGGGFGTYLQIADGASVNASAITLYNTGRLTLANNTTCTGPLTSLGGLITTFGNTALTNNITLGSNGLTVTNYTSGSICAFSGNITGSGGLTKFGFSTIGLGTLTLTGTSDYSGATIVNRGALLVNGSITSPTTVNNGGILGGSGTVGSVTVNSGGTVAPGNSPGLLTINGAYSQTSAATLAIELGGYTPGNQFDQLAVSGQAAVDGTLNVTLVNNFRPNAGDTFQIIASNGEIGNFSTINTTGFTVTSDASETGIVLTVVAVDPPITVTTIDDHDDGACDAADCTLREAIKAANTRVGDDDIVFAPNVTGTIQLASALPALSSNIAIEGPGADVLTVRRNTGGVYRLFTINPGSVVSLSGLTLTNGDATGSTGGAIYNDHATVGLTSCVVTGNKANAGGGIYNQGSTSGVASLTLNNTTLTANSTVGQFGNGGAIFSTGVSGGTALLTLTNCTVTGNTTVIGTPGIENFGFSGTASASVKNCTFSGNNFSNDHATLLVANTIFNAGNGGASLTNISGTITSQGHNLSSDAVGGDGTTAPGGFLNGPGDIRNTDPQLDPAGLANNGGPTMTIALQSTSPAIDGGDDNLAPLTDQRGYPRFGVSDIGAFELPGTLPPVPLVSIVSRKFHGGSGPFEIDLLSSEPPVECRTGGATGDHTIVFTFENPLTSVDSVALTGVGKVSSSEIGADAHEYVVNVTGVANAQTISVSLANVTDSLGNQSDTVIASMGVLLGDTTGNGNVNASDVSLTKLKSGEAADASNFREDVTVSGSINASDVSSVKLKSGTALP